MKPSFVDTDILSQFLRNNLTVVSNANKYLQAYNVINFSIIIYYEVLNGLLYKDAKNQLAAFIEFTELNRVLPLTMRSAEIAAEIYADLRKEGKPIGHTDSLIAGIALANGLQLVTNNTEHFKRVKNLVLVNWLK
ncbi:MAG: type II toxin-antitoxin system VapC family toxin [Ginsengibacter sp.]